MFSPHSKIKLNVKSALKKFNPIIVLKVHISNITRCIFPSSPTGRYVCIALILLQSSISPSYHGSYKNIA